MGLRLNFKRVDGPVSVPLPQRATQHSAGYDIYACQNVFLNPGEQAVIPLGITWKPVLWTARLVVSGDMKNDPEVAALYYDVFIGGFFAKVFDKSGHAMRYKFHCHAGVIDQDYHDPWNLLCSNDGPQPMFIEQGKKLTQFVLLPFLVAEDCKGAGETVERVGGFGSTGG